MSRDLKGPEDTDEAVREGSETHDLQMQIFLSLELLLSTKIMDELNLQEILWRDIQ